jgi:hypothetical protein
VARIKAAKCNLDRSAAAACDRLTQPHAIRPTAEAEVCAAQLRRRNAPMAAVQSTGTVFPNRSCTAAQANG